MSYFFPKAKIINMVKNKYEELCPCLTAKSNLFAHQYYFSVPEHGFPSGLSQIYWYVREDIIFWRQNKKKSGLEVGGAVEEGIISPLKPRCMSWIWISGVKWSLSLPLLNLQPTVFLVFLIESRHFMCTSEYRWKTVFSLMAVCDIFNLLFCGSDHKFKFSPTSPTPGWRPVPHLIAVISSTFKGGKRQH